MEKEPKNVLGEPLQVCCENPITGFYRDGFCKTGKDDVGQHTVCVMMTDEFLKFSKEAGNDLSTPKPEFGFPGLKAGDHWCVCVLRWKEAVDAGFGAPIKIESVNEKALEYVSMNDLRTYCLQ